MGYFQEFKNHLGKQNIMSPIANMLTTINNAQAVRHESVMVPFSKMKRAIADVLQKHGFVAEVDKKKKKIKNTEFDYLYIKLKYNDKVGAIRGMKLVSKPSRRMYAHKQELHKIMNGQGISVVTTSKGIMSGFEAKKAGVGGEVILEIW